MINSKPISVYGLVDISGNGNDPIAYQFTFYIKTDLSKKLMDYMRFIGRPSNFLTEEVFFIDLNYYLTASGASEMSCHVFNKFGDVVDFLSFNKRFHCLVFQYIRLLTVETC